MVAGDSTYIIVFHHISPHMQ